MTNIRYARIWIMHYKPKTRTLDRQEYSSSYVYCAGNKKILRLNFFTRVRGRRQFLRLQNQPHLLFKYNTIVILLIMKNLLQIKKGSQRGFEKLPCYSKSAKQSFLRFYDSHLKGGHRSNPSNAKIFQNPTPVQHHHFHNNSHPHY